MSTRGGSGCRDRMGVGGIDWLDCSGPSSEVVTPLGVGGRGHRQGRRGYPSVIIFIDDRACVKLKLVIQIQCNSDTTG